MGSAAHARSTYFDRMGAKSRDTFQIRGELQTRGEFPELLDPKRQIALAIGKTLELIPEAVVMEN